MCTFLIFNGDVGLSKFELSYMIEHAYRYNEDGLGIAWPHNNIVKSVKHHEAYDNDQVTETVWSLIQRGISPIVVHFRRASKGGISLENTHPIAVDGAFGISPTLKENAHGFWEGDAGGYVFHNGTIYGKYLDMMKLALLVQGKSERGYELNLMNDTRFITRLIEMFGAEVLGLFQDLELGVVISMYNHETFLYKKPNRNLYAVVRGEDNWMLTTEVPIEFADYFILNYDVFKINDLTTIFSELPKEVFTEENQLSYDDVIIDIAENERVIKKHLDMRFEWT